MRNGLRLLALALFVFFIGCTRSSDLQDRSGPVRSGGVQPKTAPQGTPTAATPDSEATGVRPVASSQTTMPFDEAVENGKVEAEITGIGGSTGDAILIVVRRKVAEPLILTLTPGTVFKSTSGTVQNMLGASISGERVGERSYRPGSQIILSDDDKHAYIVEAYCLDFHKGNPGTSDSFTLAPMEDRPVKILQAGKATSASIQAIQAALWMDKEGIGATELKERFPVSDADIEVARRFLAEVKPTEPPAPAAAPKTTATSPPPPIPSLAKPRTWTDNTGTHRTEATFVELKDGKVWLRKTDGTTTNVPLERLSEADQEVARTASSPNAESASSGRRGDATSVSDEAARFYAELAIFYSVLTYETSLSGIKTRHEPKPVVVHRLALLEGLTTRQKVLLVLVSIRKYMPGSSRLADSEFALSRAMHEAAPSLGWCSSIVGLHAARIAQSDVKQSADDLEKVLLTDLLDNQSLYQEWFGKYKGIDDLKKLLAANERFKAPSQTLLKEHPEYVALYFKYLGERAESTTEELKTLRNKAVAAFLTTVGSEAEIVGLSSGGHY